MITICNDMDHVKRFMTLPEVYRYCAEFGANEDPEFENGPKEAWFLYNSSGIINLHIETGSMCMFHPYILRSNKEEYDTMVQEFFKWFDENMPKEAIKLNAIIPTLFEGALLAAERAKMIKEGVDRMSYRTSKGVYDRILYGITREEIRNG